MKRTTRIGGLFAVAVLLGAGAIQASGQIQNPGDPNRRLWTPFAAGTIAGSNGVVTGSWYAYATSSNVYGFFVRAYSGSSNKLYTIVPYETLADGRVKYWWMEYAYNNGADAEDTQFWHETGSGRIVMGPGIGIPGSGWTKMLYRNNGWQNVPVDDQWRQVTFNLTMGSMGGAAPQPQPRAKPKAKPIRQVSGGQWSCPQCKLYAGCRCGVSHHAGCPATK